MKSLLRLSNGVQTASQYSGRVEVYNQGSWGTVCSNGFDNNDAQAICNMFGYKYVIIIDVRHEKTDRRVFVVVIPKEGWGPASPSLGMMPTIKYFSTAIIDYIL